MWYRFPILILGTQLFAGKRGPVVDRAALERTGAKNPYVVRGALLVDQSRLPHRCACFAVIREHGNLRDALLIAPLGYRYFRDHCPRHRLQREHLRHVHRRHAKQQIVAVRAHGTGPRLDDKVGLVTSISQLATVCQQVLAKRTDEIVSINYFAEPAVIQKHLLPGERFEIDRLNGPIDRIGNQHLLGRRAHRVRRPRRAAPDQRRCRQKQRRGNKLDLEARHKRRNATDGKRIGSARRVLSNRHAMGRRL
jgi:hypothetical protein